MAIDPQTILRGLSPLLAPTTPLRCDESLSRRTTLRVGGTADAYVEPASEAELTCVLQFCRSKGLPLLVLGRGSNLLVRDGGFRGVVVCLAHPAFAQVDLRGTRLHCGAGARLKAVAAEAKRAGLTGFEFLEGIPGSLGGALRMNAGAMGSWIFDVLESVRFMEADGRVEVRSRSEVEAGYRRCSLLQGRIALGSVLRGETASPEVIEERTRAFNQRRWASQPAAPSAGCIFKNPPAIPAGRLIDELGLKGTRVGDAVVSNVHANFIVNEGHATAQDVLRLIEIVRERARTARGIELETEVEVVGE
jgi:UDP-N-acetylenolpyruvoylglucosamine reductase